MSTRDSLPATMTVKEFADLMNISPRSAYRAIENGHVTVIRFGRNIIVPAHPVYAMLGIPTDHAPTADEGGHGGSDASGGAESDR